MPAIRNTNALYFVNEDSRIVKSDQGISRSPPRTPKPKASIGSKTPSPKKKTSNAFFLYRSYVLANNLLPVDVTHQNDASRVAAQMWREESQETRLRFFSLAEQERKKQREMEQRELEILQAATPPLSPCSTSSASSSSPRTPFTPRDRPVQVEKIRECKLFSSPPADPLPLFDYALTSRLEDIPAPNFDEPLIYALSDEWSSFPPVLSRSLMSDSNFA